MGIQALQLKKAPLWDNTQFLPILRQFTQLLGLEVSKDCDFGVDHEHRISVDDLQSLATNPPRSLRWFKLGGAELMDVDKFETVAVDDEIDSLCECIVSLMSTTFPLKHCPVADYLWRYNNS